MAKKKAKPITGTVKDPDNKLIVQKSKPLFALWRSDFTLAEFKILDLYLSRINSHKPDERMVIFEKGELEALLERKKINTEDLKDRVKHLMQPIFIPNDQSGFKGVALFEEADCQQDEKTGLWRVSLECTRKAMKYFFNVDEIGYLRYKLRSITNITSRYTYVLFTYLEANRFRKSWDVSLDELREILSCETDALYKEYKFFNQRILKRCQKELHEKTECRFTYAPIRKGRNVTAIHFVVETLPDIMPKKEIEGQMSFNDFDASEDPLAIYIEALPSDLTREEVDALRALASPLIGYDPLSALPPECHLANYLRQKVALMEASKTKKKYKYAYLKAMIEKDLSKE